MALGPLFYIFISIFLVSFWLGWTRLIGAEYWRTPRDKIDKMIKIAGIEPSMKFYDLGSGFGRIITRVARKSGANTIGIEIDPLRVLISKLRIRLLEVKNTKVKHGSIYKEDLSDSDIVFIFQRNKVNEKLKDKLKIELKTGTKVVTYYWPFENWKPEKADQKNKIYVYQI